jgi:hypothetical protein
MIIRDRVENSNKEVVTHKGELVDFKEHMALNKIVVGLKNDPKVRKVGFFKDFKGTLQLHICLETKEKKEWLKLLVLDADKEERARNARLNIIKGGNIKALKEVEENRE